jgi:hypothetical protein
VHPNLGHPSPLPRRPLPPPALLRPRGPWPPALCPPATPPLPRLTAPPTHTTAATHPCPHLATPISLPRYRPFPFGLLHHSPSRPRPATTAGPATSQASLYVLQLPNHPHPDPAARTPNLTPVPSPIGK